MMHGEQLVEGKTYVMVDPNQPLGAEYLGGEGWTSLAKAKRFSAAEAAAESDGVGSYAGWQSEEAAMAMAANQVKKPTSGVSLSM